MSEQLAFEILPGIPQCPQLEQIVQKRAGDGGVWRFGLRTVLNAARRINPSLQQSLKG